MHEDTNEEWQRSYEEEDSRWTIGAQRTDWLIVLAMLVVATVVPLLVFWLEPGLR